MSQKKYTCWEHKGRFYPLYRRVGEELQWRHFLHEREEGASLETEETEREPICFETEGEALSFIEAQERLEMR